MEFCEHDGVRRRDSPSGTTFQSFPCRWYVLVCNDNRTVVGGGAGAGAGAGVAVVVDREDDDAATGVQP